MSKKKRGILFIQVVGSIVGILLVLFIFVKIMDRISPKQSVQNVSNEMMVNGVKELRSSAKSGKESYIYNIDIEKEISEYRERFIELYTSNALDEVESQMNIEENEIDYGGNGEPTTLLKYTDSCGEVLRYQLHFYGETMDCSIDYYLCRNFVLVSRERNYYSSWVLTAGYSDVLYSSIDNWIIFDDTAYILHDDGELEKIEEMQMEIPLLEEIEEYPLARAAEDAEFQNELFKEFGI